MTSNQLIDLMNRTPFVPFDIHLADGQRIRVEEPFQVATRRNSPTCTVYATDERMHIVSLRNVTEIVTLPSASDPGA